MWKYVVGLSAIVIGLALPVRAQEETTDTGNVTIEGDPAAQNEEGQSTREMGETASADTDSGKTSDASWEFPGEFSEDEEQSVLYVMSDPPGAVVEVDESSKGKTPVEITGLTPGKHVFRIMKPGHFLKKATVTLKENVRDTLRFDLVKPVTIMLTSEPADAAVTIDGNDRGTTPLTYSKLKPGEHDITISAEGHRSFEKRLQITADDSLHVALSPEKSPSGDTAQTVDMKKKPEDAGLSRAVLNKIALGAFATFCAMIIVIELVSSD